MRFVLATVTPSVTTLKTLNDWEPIEHLAGGPGLIDLLVASPATPALADMPDGGVHFDPQARTVSLWAVQIVAGIHNWPLPRREDWALDSRGDDHTQQAGLLPADFPFPQPPLAPALRRLGEGLGTPPPDNGPLLARATAVSQASAAPHPSLRRFRHVYSGDGEGTTGSGCPPVSRTLLWSRATGIGGNHGADRAVVLVRQASESAVRAPAVSDLVREST